MKFIKKTLKLGLIFSILGILGIISLYVVAYFSPVLDIKNTGQYYIYDNDNSLLFQGSGNSKWVSLSDVSPYFIDAIISTEDKNFYKHNGFDYLRIIKTLFVNMKKGAIVGGASTISQQYVMLLYISYNFFGISQQKSLHQKKEDGTKHSILPEKNVIYFSTEAAIASARASISDRFCSWREEAMVTPSSRMSMCFSFSSSARMRAPERGAQEPFSTRATVRFWRFRAFMSARKLCMGGTMPRL